MLSRCRGSRSAYFFGTCENNVAAQWQLSTNIVVQSEIILLQVPNKYRNLDLMDLEVEICSKFVQENKALARGVCLPQPCWSAGRRLDVSRIYVTFDTR